MLIKLNKKDIKKLSEHCNGKPLIRRLNLVENIFSNERILKEKNLRLVEGVFKTYDTRFVLKHLCNYLGLTNVWTEFRENPEKYSGYVQVLDMDNGENGFVFFLKYDTYNKNTLRKTMSLCGYYESCVEETDVPEYQEVIFEKTKQNTVNEVVYNKRKIFHLTLMKKISKIRLNGLCPKSGNKKSKHPERIYFFLDKPKSSDLKNFIAQLYGFEMIKQCLLLTISTENLENNFYFDPNTINSIYTTENIKPENIIEINKIV